MKINLSFLKRLPAHEWRMTLPNFLTILRLLTVPVTVVMMVKHQWGMAFGAFLFAALTDICDGFLARYLNQKTFLGACLDPIADKALILSVYFTLAFVQSPLFSIPLWFVVLVLMKELVLIGGAALLFYQKGFLKVAPTALGKATMAVQTLFIIWLFACYFFHWLPVKTYYTSLGVVLILVLSSLYQYAKIGFKQARAYLS